MKISICGDFAPRNTVLRRIEQNDIEELFCEVKPILISSDLSIINLEAPAYEGNSPILKSGPNLKCPLSTINALEAIGCNCVTLANNHLKDHGEQGVISTIEAIKKTSIDYVGAGKNISEAERILYKGEDEIKVAIINLCENEFSIATEDSAGCNPLNPVRNYYKIIEAKKNANFVIVIIHGGTETYNLPTPRMKETYRFFIDAGADAVINHHQHCYTGYEVYKNSPIFYGIGNFCFDNGIDVNKDWNEGYIVQLFLEKNKQIDFNLIPYTQTISNEHYITILKDRRDFDNQIIKLNKIIDDDNELNKQYSEECKKRKKTYINYLYPYTSKIMRTLYYRGILKLPFNPKQLKTIQNICRCEAHRDMFLKSLE